MKYSACDVGSSAAFAPSVTTRRFGAEDARVAASVETEDVDFGGASAASDW
jgi:hypothetical protein